MCDTFRTRACNARGRIPHSRHDICRSTIYHVTACLNSTADDTALADLCFGRCTCSIIVMLYVHPVSSPKVLRIAYPSPVCSSILSESGMLTGDFLQGWGLFRQVVMLFSSATCPETPPVSDRSIF